MSPPNIMSPRTVLSSIASALLVASAICAPTSLESRDISSPAAPGDEWSGWGGNIYNNRWASNNSEISSSSAASLVQKCQYTYHLGVSATPTVNGDVVYYPTWGGQFVALNYKTCTALWNISVADIINDYAPVTSLQKQVLQPVSRSSPQIDGNVLYFTTVVNALLVAVDLNSGALLAKLQINPHPLAQLTMSPTVYNGRIFIGASSFEEVAADTVPGYQCCSFLGNMAGIDFDKTSAQFNVAWNVSMLPSGQGWSGAAIWGSQPPIDAARSQVFIGTGNVYTVPPAYQECINQTANITVIADGLVPSTCIPSNVYQEAIMAFDLETGDINWSRQLSPLDAWQLACGTIGGGVPKNDTLCPFNPGPDADFGMAPTFVPGSNSTPQGKDTLVIGQKNGDLHALSAQAGTPFWSTITSPDGSGGGLIWGIAVDEDQVYFTAANTGLQTWQIQPSNQTIVNSAFGAAKLIDGSLVWETASPENSSSLVPPTVVNDVVFFGRTGENITGNSQATHGGLVVVNKMTGEIIKDYDLNSNFHGGVAVQNQYVMFGTGYSPTAAWNGSGEFQVWSV